MASQIPELDVAIHVERAEWPWRCDRFIWRERVQSMETFLILGTICTIHYLLTILM